MPKEVVIFRNIPEDSFLSMGFYADSLKSSLLTNRFNNFLVEDFQPNLNIPIFKNYSFLKKIIKNFAKFAYHFIAKKKQGDINHIVDHRYSHLLYGLDENRTVITCHDLRPFYYRFPILRERIWKYEINGLKKAAKIIAVSENTKKDIIKFLGIDEQRIVVAYNGVGRDFRIIEDKNYLKEIRKKYGLNSGLYILHVGANHKWKNIPTILKTIDILNNKMQLNVNLIKVGDEFTKKQKKIIENLNIKEKVIYLGKIPTYELVGIYNISDLLLFPSFYEGFGWPPLEAMACGTPVVSSNTSSLPEVVGNAAIMVNPYDIEGMARACYDILTNQSLAKSIIKKGLERAKLFSWEKHVEIVTKVYRKILER